MNLDSTILIDLAKGKKSAQKYLQSTQELSISIIVKLELLAGARNKEELKLLKQMTSDLQLNVIHLSSSISHLAENIFIKYHHNCGIGIMDALIAATALNQKQKLVTHNLKHFPFIPNLKTLKPY